jgi:hypothetical protein
MTVLTERLGLPVDTAEAREVGACVGGPPHRWVTGASIEASVVGMFVECVDGGLIYLAKIADVETAAGGAGLGVYITLEHPWLPGRHAHQERIFLSDDDALALVDPCHAPLAWPNLGSP